MSKPGDGGRHLQVGARSGPRRVVAALLGVAGLLVVLSLGTRYLAYRADVAARGSERTTAWITIMKLFDANSETNVPTWFSSALLLAAAVAAGLVGVMVRGVGGRDGGRWLALAGILALLSLDEASALHERLGGPARALLGDSAGRFAWVVPGAVLAAVVGTFFVGFLARLPRRIRRHVLGAGATFLLGAIVIEAISGAVLDAQGDRIAYLLVTAAEEGLEMAGACWFLYAPLSCLAVTADSAGSYRLALRGDLCRGGGHHAARAGVDFEVAGSMPQPGPSTGAGKPQAGHPPDDGA